MNKTIVSVTPVLSNVDFDCPCKRGNAEAAIAGGRARQCDAKISPPLKSDVSPLLSLSSSLTLPLPCTCS